MKTPQEEIQFIVENTDGECWHEPDGDDWDVCRKCKHIAKDRDGFRETIGSDNPSPHSLDDLVRLAEKNGINHIKFQVTERLKGPSECELWSAPLGYNHGYGKTKSDALRNALVKVIEGNQ